MKVIDRYIIREFMGPLLFGLGLFLLALVTDKLFDLLDLVLRRGVSPLAVGYLLLCLLPSIIAVTLPMATLLASLMSFGRFAGDRELMAMKSAGLGLGRLMAPLLGVGIAFSAMLLVFNGTVMPEANMRYKKLFFEILKKRATVAFRERVFIREFDQYILYFNRKEGENAILKDLVIMDLTSSPPRFIGARRGQLLVDEEGMSVRLALEDGVVDQPLDTDGTQYSRIRFAGYDLGLDIGKALSGGGLFVKGISEMDYRDLWRAMRDPASGERDRRSYNAEFHQRIALAFAPFFVILIGVSLGALARRGGGVGLVLSLAVIFCYYIFLTMAQGAAEGGKVPAWLALWMPNAFMGLAGLAAFYAATRESRWIRWGR